MIRRNIRGYMEIIDVRPVHFEVDWEIWATGDDDGAPIPAQMILLHRSIFRVLLYIYMSGNSPVLSSSASSSCLSSYFSSRHISPRALFPSSPRFRIK